MCGILAVVARPNSTLKLKQQQLHAMRDSMASRGPDGAGEFARENIWMGHRLLAIRDVQAGQQPWISEDRQIALVFNGEIYNDQQLRRQLTATGYRFRTRCDTETLMAAYQTWGADCLSRINGMFAFVAYNFATQELLAARDPVGIKPLYFLEKGGELFFSSTVKALTMHPQFSRVPNWVAISHYLSTLRMTLGHMTLYKDIYQLRPGQCLMGQGEKISVKEYRTLKLFRNELTVDDLSFEEATDKVSETMQQVVQSQMQSDVPVGLFLSGGLDSSLLAHTMQDKSDTTMQSYYINGNTQPGQPSNLKTSAELGLKKDSVIAGGQDPTDDIVAVNCADRCGMEHQQVVMGSDDYYQDWRKLIAETELPLSTPSDVMIYRMSVLAKKQTSVVLGGEGADEFFCGYSIPQWSGRDYDHMQLLRTGRWALPSSCKPVFEESWNQNYGSTHYTNPVEHYLAHCSVVPWNIKSTLMSPDFLKQCDQDRPILSYYHQYFEARRSTQDSMIHMLQSLNLEGLLLRLDSSTMLAGLEARVPYTDPEMIALSQQLPMSYRLQVSETEREPYRTAPDLMQRGTLESKRVLRNLADRHLPQNWNHRHKGSFPTPFLSWTKQGWLPELQETLSSSEFLEQIVSEPVLQEIRESPESAGLMLWPLLNLAYWGEQAFAA
jgi:asparagine synthase (glutamine-hydrolysing)